MSNLPNSKINDLEKSNPAAVREIVGSLRELHMLGRPKTDEEVEDRIDQYFEFCENSCLRPGIESLCLALHISRTTLFRWNKGTDCSARCAEAIQKAKGFIAAFLEQASICGRLNPATSIFLMKNWLGYRDTLSMEQIADEEAPRKSSVPAIPDMYEKYVGEMIEPPTPDF